MLEIVAKLVIFVFHEVRNIVGKGENVGHQHISAPIWID